MYFSDLQIWKRKEKVIHVMEARKMLPTYRIESNQLSDFCGDWYSTGREVLVEILVDGVEILV